MDRSEKAGKDEQSLTFLQLSDMHRTAGRPARAKCIIGLNTVMLLTLIIFCRTAGALHAQNLVPNPDFEYYTACPPGINTGWPLECEPWYRATSTTPDYFHACNPSSVGVPNNYYGVQPAHSGDAYIGGVFYLTPTSDYREYIGVQLTEPLVAGTSYLVSLYYSRSSLTCPIDKVGVFISTDQVYDPSTTVVLPFSPQIEIATGLIEGTGWHLLSGCYVALGGEQWITIGNFYPNAETNTDPDCTTSLFTIYSYIYIDDVSVVSGPPPGDIVFSLGADVTSCDSFEIVVPVENANYIWQDGAHGQTYMVTSTGLYSVTVIQGCNAGTDEIYVTILDSPQAIDLGEPVQNLCPGESLVYTLDPGLGTYQWQDGSTSSTYSITTPGTYSVTVINSCGSADAQVVVSLLDPPAPADLGPDVELCLLGTLTLSFDPSSGDFLWQDGSTGSSYLVDAAGIYSVTISNACGSVTDTIEVSYLPEPIVYFDVDTVFLCAGETTTFTFDPMVGDYFWQDGSSGAQYTVTEPGIYTVTVMNACGSDFASVVVSYVYEPVVDLGPDLVLCPQQLPHTIDLTGLPGADNFLWDDGTAGPVFTINTSGTYGVTVSNACFSVWDILVVLVEDFPPLVELPPDALLCEGDILYLDVSHIPGTYIWQDGFTAGVYAVAAPGWYSVTVSSACGESSDSVNVEFIDPLPVPDLGGDITLCPGEQAVIYAGVAGVNYLWNDGSTLDSIVVSEAGVISLTIFNACALHSDEITVSVNADAPDAGLPDTLGLCAGDSIVIATPVAGAEYQWNTGETSVSIAVSDPGVYILTVTNSCGSDTDSTVVIDLGTSPVLDLGTDQSVCPGDSVFLNPGVSGTYLWHDGSAEMSYVSVVSEQVSLTVTNACGIGSATVQILFLDPIPQLDLGSDTSICPGTTVVFAPGIEDVVYTWHDGSTTESFETGEAGWVHLSIANSCDVTSDSVLITLLPAAPVLDLGPDISICPGDEITIAPGIPDVSYLWHDGSTDIKYRVSGDEFVVLTISNACGSATDSVQVVTSTAGPVLDLGPDISVCEGDTVLIRPGIAGVMYAWHDGSTGPSFTVTSTSQIILEISNSCGSARDTLEVVVSGAVPDIDLGSDTTLCAGEVLILVVENSVVSIEWQDGTTDSVLFVTEAGSYSVIATNVCGIAYDTIHVSMLNSPATFDLGGDVVLCQEDTHILYAPDAAPGDVLMWNDGSSHLFFEVFTAGHYSLSVSNDCGIAADTVFVAFDDREIAFSPEFHALCPGEMVVLDVTQPFDAMYLWETGHSVPQITVMAPGAYPVTISTECAELAEIVTVEEGRCINTNIFVPNVFSPNGDNINDVFSVHIDPAGVLAFQVRIFDRWGGLLFESNVPDFTWDGTSNGSALMPGVYVYFITVVRQTGEREVTEHLKGDITLIR